ncbi:MAG: hypothetical protein H6713_16520 [Myxococcales bacterium]|nr:hypothetical protein [Myxococcales bacterium]
MNTTPRRLSALLLTAPLLACTPALGNLTENSDTEESASESESESNTSTTTGSSTANITATDSGATDSTDGSSSTVTSATSSTVTTATEGGTESSSGGTDTAGAICDSPNQDCPVYPIDCEAVNCGAPDSYFDEDGCLRASCSSEDDCADGELCYGAILWGGCASSDIFCEDDPQTEQCACGSTDDCNGAFCIPSELYPDEQLIGPARVADSCAPNDGPAFTLDFGLESATCDAQPAMNALRVQINYTGILDWVPMAPGEYPLENNVGWAWVDLYGDGNPQEVTSGVLTIESWENDTVTGAIEMHLEGAPTIKSTFTAPHCVGAPLCG